MVQPFSLIAEACNQAEKEIAELTRPMTESKKIDLYGVLDVENPCVEAAGQLEIRTISEIKSDFQMIRPAGKPIKGLFIASLTDAEGNLVFEQETEHNIVSDGFDELIHVELAPGPLSGIYKAMSQSELMKQTSMDIEVDAAQFDDIHRALAQSEVFARKYGLISEVNFPEQITAKSGDIVSVGYTINSEEPSVIKDPKIKILTLADRLTACVEQHRAKFIAAGIAEPDELITALGMADIINPEIPGFGLPCSLPRRIPIDLDLITTVVEAEHYSDELRFALMSQIAIYGAPAICGLLESLGVDPEFIDSLTSNLPRN